MKRKFYVSLFCGLLLLIAGHGVAQTNISYDKANQIVFGNTIVSQFTPGTVEVLWYEFNVTEGSWYEIPHPPYALSIFVNEQNASSGSDWYGYTYNDSYEEFRAILFQAERTGTYYIRRDYNPSVGASLEWSLIHVTDNRVCNNAETIVVDNITEIPTGQFFRWYRADLEAGKYYTTETSGAATLVYESCGSDAVLSGEDVYYAATSGYRYFRLRSIEENASLKIKEVAKQTNTSHAAASAIELGQPIEYSHAFGASLYFKFDVEEGKTYEVAGTLNHFYHSPIVVYQPNENSPIDTEQVTVYSMGYYRFQAPQSGTIYIKRSTTDVNNEVIRMTVNQITDARICENAIEVSEGQEIAYDHKNYSELWWKIELDANSSYLVDFNNTYGNSVSLSIFDDCGQETALESSSNTFDISAINTAYYYIRSKSYYLYPDDDGSSFTISKLANDNNPNCASARLIAVGEQVSTSHIFGNPLWYKVNVEGGKVYELDGSRILYSQNIYVEVFTSCDAELPIAEDGYKHVLYFMPEEDTTYYIKWTGSDAYATSYSWNFNEVVDNRTCQTATPVVLNQNITMGGDQSRASNDYWFTLPVVSGKFYEIDFSNGYADGWMSDRMHIYDACGEESSLQSFTKSKHLLAPESTGVLYLRVEQSYARYTLTWKVSEVSGGDNRLCDYAQNISLGVNIQTDHTPGYIDQWYKISFEGGKVYEVDASQIRKELYYYEGEVCNTDAADRLQNYIYPNTKSLIYPKEDVVYYFRSVDDKLSANFTWQIKETAGDNRLCEFATPVSLETPFTVDNSVSRSFWYQLEVTAGAKYAVDFPETYYQYVYIYDGCDGNQIAMGYANAFIFDAQQTGIYYLNFLNQSVQPTFDCTIHEITDNRSCLYAESALVNVSISGQYDNSGLWYSVALEEGILYEFDFTGASGRFMGHIYTSCEEEESVASGSSEKTLYQAPTSDTYLVHVSSDTPSQQQSWIFVEKSAGDRRLCEYAEEVNVGDTIPTDLVDSWRNQWYKVNVKAGKYYEIGNIDKNAYDPSIEVYADCGLKSGDALASIVGAGVLFAESDAVWYLKVRLMEDYFAAPALWYITEVSPEGRVCDFGLDITPGGRITTINHYARAEFTAEGWDYPYTATEGTWYKLSIDEAGTYDIRLPNWEYYEENDIPYFPFYFAHVFSDCDLTTSYIKSAGHMFNVGRISFEAEENSVYYILTENHETFHYPFTWEIIQTSGPSAQTGVISVSLVDENGGFLSNASMASVFVYRKENNTLTFADRAAWTDGNGSGMFDSRKVRVGTYIIHVDSVPGYLAEWYNQAGVWQDATEIELSERGVSIEVCPRVVPEDISSGDISISGTVYDVESGSETAIEGVSVSVYREKPAQQQSQAQKTNVPYRVVNSVIWELVATVKTDANGQYEINMLPKGRYKLVVDLPGYAIEDEGIVIDAIEGQNYSNNNFEADESTMTVTNQRTGLHQPALQGIGFYPNPFDQEAIISYAENCWLQVFSVEGVQVYTQQLTQTRETVQLNNLPSGIYYIRLERDGQTASFTAIKR